MRLNHINLATSDVPASRAFLETYFGLRCVSAPDGARVVVLRDDDDCAITLSNFGAKAEIGYPASFHIGFMQTTREAVDAVNARFRGDGFAVGRCREFHGAWTFYLKAPGGFTVEVGYQHGGPDQAPKEGADRMRRQTDA